ncbi:MAG: acylphosphatase [Pseudomonadota bacterium]|nr:acylphosphatase [Pseudomonadota bacterium]
MTEIQGTVIGKVQGVQFHDYVQVIAGELGVVGYVKNNQDGSVLVVAQAQPGTLKNFVEYLHEGSVLSLVEGVAVEWRTAEVAYSDFSVR